MVCPLMYAGQEEEAPGRAAGWQGLCPGRHQRIQCGPGAGGVMSYRAPSVVQSCTIQCSTVLCVIVQCITGRGGGDESGVRGVDSGGAHA